MRHLGLDADAFNFLRSLRLLDDLAALAQPPEPKVALHTTAYVARHELSSLSREIDAMEKSSTLAIWQVRSKTPAFARFRELAKDFDKGETGAP